MHTSAAQTETATTGQELINSMGNELGSAARKLDRKSKLIQRVLFVDDDPGLAKIIAKQLSKNYFIHVDIAEDPFDAMNMMAEHFYDLIVLDWMLPGLTGGQTLRQAEKDLFFEPSLSIKWDQERVPVVIFSSAKKKFSTSASTKHFDCIGFVTKGQSFENILQIFEELIGPRASRRQIVA